MTARSSPARNVVRRFNKHVLNPVMVHLAGREHWYAAAIRHTGRRSGRHYTTPVVADRIASAITVPLPYGVDVDWLKNIQQSGSAAVTVHGETFDVVEPRVIDAAAAQPLLTARHCRAFQRFGISEFVTMRAVR